MARADDFEVQLSAPERELLQRAREQRRLQAVPDEVRLRLLRRALEDAGAASSASAAGSGASGPAVAATDLVVVPQWTWRSAAQLLAAGACAMLLLFGARRLLWSLLDTRQPQPEAQRGAPSPGERLLDTPLFRKPAPTLPAGEAPPAGANLFPEQPFSQRSGAWQVRRWDDLRVAPAGAAAHDFSEGVLCFPLAAGQRVFGGWPWAAGESVTPQGVALAPGRPYRLYFKAWAREPLPAQLLIGVGHARLPFSAAAGARVPVTAEPQTFVIDVFSANGDPSAGVAFLATGARDAEPTRVCVSDVTLVER